MLAGNSATAMPPKFSCCFIGTALYIFSDECQFGFCMCPRGSKIGESSLNRSGQGTFELEFARGRTCWADLTSCGLGRYQQAIGSSYHKRHRPDSSLVSSAVRKPRASTVNDLCSLAGARTVVFPP